MGKANGVDQEATRSALRAFMDRTGTTQSAVAAAIGMSAAAVSQWLKGSYVGDCEKLAAGLTAYLGIEEKRAEAGDRTGFAETSVASEILMLCEFAAVHRCIAVANGEAGAGKTTALVEYRTRHPETILVRCNPAFRTPKGLLEGVLNGLGRAPGRGLNQLNRLTDEVCDLLAGTGRMLILDEAQFLTRDSLEVARTIHDVAGIPLVLSGNYDLYNRMTGKGESLWAQVFSRVGIHREIRRTTTVADVRALAGDVDEDCVKFLHERAREPGCLRRMEMVLKMGRELARRESVPLTRSHLQMAATLLIGGGKR